jgi:hypothetical protein
LVTRTLFSLGPSANWAPRLLGLCAALLLAVQASAAWAARLQLAVERNEVSLGDTVALQVQLVDGRSRGVPEVKVGEGLSARFRGQSQETVMVNFETTRILNFTYALSAVAVGSWEVGPVEVEVNGQLVRAEAITIKVVERAAGAGAAASVRAALSDPRPFVGEVLTYGLTFEHRGTAYNPRWTPPELPGFAQVSQTEPDQSDSTTRRDGVELTVAEVRLPMVALSPGARDIEPAVLTADMPAPPDRRTGRRAVDMFGRERTRPETFSTQKLHVEVRPLPEPRPDDFSGLVGSFELEVSPLPASLPLGGTLTQEVRLRGRGSLSGFKLPSAATTDRFRVYDDAPTVVTGWRQGLMVSEALFRRALVPELEGTLVVPPTRLVVFDPEQEQYVTLTAPGGELLVTPGEAGGAVQRFAAAPAAGGGVVEALGDDILPAPTQVVVSDQSLRGALPLALGAPALPLLGLLGLGLRRRLAGWTPRAAAAAPGLDALPPPGPARLLALEGLLRARCAARLGCAPPAVDRAAVAGLDAETLQLYVDLEAARYGGEHNPALEARLIAHLRAPAGGAA